MCLTRENIDEFCSRESSTDFFGSCWKSHWSACYDTRPRTQDRLRLPRRSAGGPRSRRRQRRRTGRTRSGSFGGLTVRETTSSLCCRAFLKLTGSDFLFVAEKRISHRCRTRLNTPATKMCLFEKKHRRYCEFGNSERDAFSIFRLVNQ